MKTKLPSHIKTTDEAKTLLKALYENGESFHPEDNAHDIAWTCEEPTDAESDQLNSLMNDIYNLPGNDDHLNMAFCPCEYLLYLDPDYKMDEDE